MIWILGFLLAVFIVDGVRLRARMASLRVIPATSAANTDGYRVVAAPGIFVDEAAAQSAAAWAQANGLDVVDLVPADLPAARALALAGSVNPATYRRSRFAPGRTAGCAMIVSREVWLRAESSSCDGGDSEDLVTLAARLKRYACTTTDIAVACGLHAGPEDPRQRLAALRMAFGAATPFALALEGAMIGALVLGVTLAGARMWGMAAIIAYHVQPLFVLAGGPIRSRDHWRSVLLRMPLQLVTWARTVAAAQSIGSSDTMTARRVGYTRELAAGIERFFEQRRNSCPLCGSSQLRQHLRTIDLLQHKPGFFTVERCCACGHLFQNPRLSPAGLRFYYEDFYDGLGEPVTNWIFELTDRAYLKRARMVESTPRRWLDVGAGHGQFCCAAREVWPHTEFDALDFGDGIAEAVRRRWVDDGYRGLFADFAPSAAGRYDVVSMSHYLEHTSDPSAELRAAHTALDAGGHLLIEVPNPESLLGRILGRYWIGFFQPQHLHLLSARNLAALLERHGFQPVRWHYSEAHTSGDFALAAAMLLMRIAPPDWPWRPPQSGGHRAWRRAVWTIGAPLLVLAFVFDEAIAPVVRFAGASNAYRVVARKL